MTRFECRTFADGFKFLEGPRWRDGALVSCPDRLAVACALGGADGRT